MSKYAYSDFGKIEVFCCEAQMYLHLTKHPSPVLEFCKKCHGHWVDSTHDPDLEKAYREPLRKQMEPK